MEKILVVRYRFIGDTVLTIPFLRNLRKAKPDAQIDMLVGPVSGDVLINCPYIDNLITFDTTRKHKYENTKEKRKTFFNYVKLLKSAKYDKAYVLKRSLSSAALVFFIGIKDRIGFDTEGRGILLTKKVPYSKDKHEIECFLDVLKADNLPILDNYLENWVSEGSSQKLNEIFENLNISNPSPKVLIHATSGNKNKHWSSKSFAEVIEHLVNKKDVQIFYTGTESDRKIYDEIHTYIKTELNIKPVNLCGDLSIQDSMALIQKMNFVIGVDSGTLHLASSLNIPVIGIYGPMDPTKWKAWGDYHRILYSEINCIPCELKKKCTKNIQCLKDITPEIVINNANDLLGEVENE